ncbi:MAG: hypothetical protein IJO03_06065 [Clostridia bacterium]|nr:hypothetical protein [Clostridia bacterium]MBQ7121814.1 hypothetical protein [Clostridia bacterium]
MPQRKTHDVYSGNQKVGEIWERYDNKSSLEAEMNVKIAAAEMCLKESKAQDAIDRNPKLKKKQDRMFKRGERAEVAGNIFIAVAVIVAVVFFALMFLNPETIFDMIPMVYFYFIPGGIFGFGWGLKMYYPELDVKRNKPKFDWGGILFMFLACGLGFTFGYFLLTIFIRNFFLL